MLAEPGVRSLDILAIIRSILILNTKTPQFISLLWELLHSGVAGGASTVPGEVADVDKGGGGLLPADCALAVAVDHVLEDPGELAGGVPLGGELGQLALQPDLADVGGVAEVGVGRWPGSPHICILHPQGWGRH